MSRTGDAADPRIGSDAGPTDRVYYAEPDVEANARLLFRLGLTEGWVHRIEFQPRTPAVTFTAAALVVHGFPISRLAAATAPLLNPETGRRLLPFFDYTNPATTTPAEHRMALRCEAYDPMTVVVECAPCAGADGGGALHVSHTDAEARSRIHTMDLEFPVRIPHLDSMPQHDSFGAVRERFVWANNVLVHKDGLLREKYQVPL